MTLQLKLTPVYCIDTSPLINLKNYPEDIFPTIWNTIESMVRSGDLVSHIEVYKEIDRIKDEIRAWCIRNKRMFRDVNKIQIEKLQHVQNQYDTDYWNIEVNKTSPWADPWVISMGISEGAIIITNEKNKPNGIPKIAGALGVKCLGLFDFFRTIGIK